MLKKTVVIGSEEFKKAVLDVLKNAKGIVINDIENTRFERLYDGWIKDHETELEWGPSSSSNMNWSKAEEYCKSLGGRLPTVDELQTILDRTLYNPTCDPKIFKDVKNEYYWTSTKYMGCSDARWCVGFCHGYVLSNLENGDYYVRPCRVSQCG